ncbi:MAG: Mut7-C RNAse domain-containing protein [Thermoplasmatota archaeon]
MKDDAGAGKGRFLCDHMLGSLARWLRLLGHDTLYPGLLEDRELLRIARAERRILLTRDRELAARAGEPGVLVRGVELEEQLEQLIREGVVPRGEESALTRCSLCNGLLEDMPREEAKGRVPEAVLARQPEFWRCSGCGQIYWPGSHYDNILKRISRIERRAGGGRG